MHAPYCHTAPLCMLSALVAPCPDVAVRQAWRSGPGGPKVLWGQEKPFPPWSREQQWGLRRRWRMVVVVVEGEDALSREECPECCPLIWSQPHTLSLSLALTLLFSLGFIWPPLAFLLPCGREDGCQIGRETDWKCKAADLRAKDFTAQLRADSLSLCDCPTYCICISVQATGNQRYRHSMSVSLVSCGLFRGVWVTKGYVKQNREWEGWERETKEERMQTWLEEEEGKGPKKKEQNCIATGECPFSFLQLSVCCYNHLMKTVVTLCVQAATRSMFQFWDSQWDRLEAHWTHTHLSPLWRAWRCVWSKCIHGY